MSIITSWNDKVFSKGKESYESTLVFTKLWEITYVIPLSSPVSYLMLLKISLYFPSSNPFQYPVPL